MRPSPRETTSSRGPLPADNAARLLGAVSVRAGAVLGFAVRASALHPPAQGRARERIEEQAERDAEEEQQRVARGVLCLALDSVGSRPELLDRLLELRADLFVARDSRRHRGSAPAAEQLVVDLACGDERTPD